MERGDDTASAACTSILYRVCSRVFVMTPPNEHTSEGGETIEGSRTMRNRPYPVLKSIPHTVLALALRCPSPKPAPVQSATQVAVHSVQVQSKCSAEAQHSVLSARSATSTEC